VIFDADTKFPDVVPWGEADPARLSGACRRILADPADYRDDLDWARLPLEPYATPIGFFQLFHADAVRDKRPWYDPTFAHAAGGDAHFMEEAFRQADWAMLPGLECLHLGTPEENWFGADDAGRTLAREFHARTAAGLPAGVPHRVDLPGRPRSAYEFPRLRRPAGRA
jgi:hypothetical protein